MASPNGTCSAINSPRPCHRSSRPSMICKLIENEEWKSSQAAPAAATTTERERATAAVEIERWDTTTTQLQRQIDSYQVQSTITETTTYTTLREDKLVIERKIRTDHCLVPLILLKQNEQTKHREWDWVNKKNPFLKLRFFAPYS